MKFLIQVILFFGVISDCFSQNLIYGPYQNFKTNNSSVEISGETEKEIFVLQKIKRTFQLKVSSIVVYAYDKQSMQQKWFKEIKLNKGIFSDKNFHSLLVLKNDVHLVFVSSNTQNTKIFLFPLLDENSNLKMITQLPFTKPDKLSLVAHSQKSLFSIAAITYNQKDELKNINLMIFNDSLKSICTTESEIKLTGNYFFIYKHKFNEHNSTVNFIISSREQEFFKKSGLQFMNISLNGNSGANSFALSNKLNGKFIDLESDNYGNTSLVGRADGKPVLYFCDSVFNQIVVNQIDTIKYEAAQTEPTDDYVDVNKNKSVFAEKDFNDMVIKNLYSPYPGRWIAACEKRFTEQICNSLPMRYGGMQCINFYYNYHIYIFDFDLRKNTLNNYKLEKKQATQEDFGAFNSFLTICDSISTVFLFNDDNDNYRSSRKRRVSMTYPAKSIFAAYMYNHQNASVENFVIDKSSERQTIIKPSSFYQTQMNICYALSNRRNTFRIVKIIK